MLYFLITYVVTGLLVIAAGIPLWLGKVAPNNFYGVRLPQTLNNSDLWYRANAYGGKLLVIVGIVQIVFCAAVYHLPHISLVKYSLCCLGICLGSLLYAFSLIMRLIEKSN